jgi:hypothetical protein
VSRRPSAEPDASDQVGRFGQLRFQYPQAHYKAGGDGWIYGSLRDEDTVMRASSLERLIDALLRREP